MFEVEKRSKRRASRRARARALVSALMAAPALACSGTDVGYPRYILVDGSGAAETAGASDLGATGGDGGTQNGTGGSVPGGATGGTRASTGGGTSNGGTGSDGGGGGTNAGSPSGGSGGGDASGGTGAASGTGGSTATSGGSSGTGGAEPGGTAGTGIGGMATGGATTAELTWPASFDASVLPEPSDGHHNAGASCMSSSCHGTKVPFVFGGTVYRADGTTGAANVEVGVADGTSTLTAYSATNGNLWLPSAAGAIDWPNAVIVVRNAGGEVVKPADAPRGSACNGSGCHNSTQRLVEP